MWMPEWGGVGEERGTSEGTYHFLLPSLLTSGACPGPPGCKKSVDPIHPFLSSLLTYLCMLRPVLHCPDWCSFIVNLGIRWCHSSSFVLLRRFGDSVGFCISMSVLQSAGEFLKKKFGWFIGFLLLLLQTTRNLVALNNMNLLSYIFGTSALRSRGRQSLSQSADTEDPLCVLW